jgi:hypothetical protein
MEEHNTQIFDTIISRRLYGRMKERCEETIACALNIYYRAHTQNEMKVTWSIEEEDDKRIQH